VNEIEVANIIRPEEIVVLTPNQSTDVLVNKPPAPPTTTEPGQREDFFRDVGNVQGTAKEAGKDMKPTPRIPVTGSGAAKIGLPVDSPPDAGFVRGRGIKDVEDPVATTPSTGDVKPTPDPSTLPSPPSPPSN
jgi:hypothetical protein